MLNPSPKPNSEFASGPYIPVRISQINYYRHVPLYYHTGSQSYALYKPEGITVDELRIDEDRCPRLFIHQEDRIAAIKELQKAFNRHMAQSIESGDVVEVKSTLCNLVEETLSEPRSGTLRALPETVDILVTGYSKNPVILRTLATISFKDYTTVIHSVNVMALTMAFCFHAKLSLKKIKNFGLSALLHDVGKAEIPSEILKAPRRLTDREFKLIKMHPAIGEKIIRQEASIKPEIALGALEHHEKLDGSGYPKATRNISFIGQLLGVIDCYEALTNEERPYRRAQNPFDTLKLIKDEVQAGKFDQGIFEKFCYSLI